MDDNGSTIQTTSRSPLSDYDLDRSVPRVGLRLSPSRFASAPPLPDLSSLATARPLPRPSPPPPAAADPDTPSRYAATRNPMDSRSNPLPRPPPPSLDPDTSSGCDPCGDTPVPTSNPLRRPHTPSPDLATPSGSAVIRTPIEGGASQPSGEVLLSRFVRFINEIAEVIEGEGLPSLDEVLSVALKGIPSSESQDVIRREVLRYQEEVEKPAELALRSRKLHCPSAVKKVPVHFSSGGDDTSFYRQALEGMEPHLVQVADPPEVTYMALRVSWPRDSALHGFSAGSFISSVHRNMLALYAGPYRPGLGTKGFYVTYDVEANSIAVIPRLPSNSVSMFSHVSIGTGVTVLNRGGLPSEFLLVELLLRRSRRGRPSVEGTVFRWWSSPPATGCWIQNEVTLPVPVKPDEHTMQQVCAFCADIAFAVGSDSICWVDLLMGILICDDICAPKLRFRFIELPPKCTIKPGIEGRGTPTAHRSICCVEGHEDQAIKFISMDRYNQREPYGVTCTIWILPSMQGSSWEKCCSFSFEDVPIQPIYRQMFPSFPLLSMDNKQIIYVTVAPDLRSVPEVLEECVRYVLCIDMKHACINACYKLPPGSACTPSNLLPSILSSYLRKSPRNEDQECGTRMAGINGSG